MIAPIHPQTVPHAPSRRVGSALRNGFSGASGRRSAQRNLRLGKRSGGYVLVVTLGLLVLSATLMVAISRGAMRHTVAARLAADDLQHRWGIISCRSATLPFAEPILLNAEMDQHVAIPILRARVQLGAEDFELTLADELAKADVNRLLDHTDRPTAEERLRQGLVGTGMAGNVRLRPAVIAVSDTTAGPATHPSAQVPQWFSGFGQVFDDAAPDRLLSAQGGVKVADLLTCWGGGRLNLRRVTSAALKLAVGTAMSGVDQNRLLAARDSQVQGKPLPALPRGQVIKDPIARLVATAGVDSKSIAALPTLTMISTCHSVWITARDKRRTWHYLSIFDATDREHPVSAAFVW